MDNHKEEWFKEMQEEMQSLNKNLIYKLVDSSTGKRTLKNKMGVQVKDLGE